MVYNSVFRHSLDKAAGAVPGLVVFILAQSSGGAEKSLFIGYFY